MTLLSYINQCFHVQIKFNKAHVIFQWLPLIFNDFSRQNAIFPGQHKIPWLFKSRVKFHDFSRPVRTLDSQSLNKSAIVFFSHTIHEKFSTKPFNFILSNFLSVSRYQHQHCYIQQHTSCNEIQDCMPSYWSGWDKNRLLKTTFLRQINTLIGITLVMRLLFDTIRQMAQINTVNIFRITGFFMLRLLTVKQQAYGGWCIKGGHLHSLLPV